MKRDRLHIVFTIAVMAFIFVHSAMPGDMSGNESRYFAEFLASITGLSFPVAQFIVRKAAHFTVFTVLGICLSMNFNDYKTQNELTKTNEQIKTDKGPAKQLILGHPLLAAWITGTLYACTDEFHQLFVVGRSGELRDVCIDSAGVILGVAIAVTVRAIKNRDTVR
jgi:VanZ family protein